MTATDVPRSAEIRHSLSHPVIDSDGHWIEPIPILVDYIDKIGGRDAAEAYTVERQRAGHAWYAMTPSERMARRLRRPNWWGMAGNTLDRATATLPALMYERLDDFGIDFAVILPTAISLGSDPKLRKVFARATNLMQAELFAPFSARMTPAAVIPTHTPEEGIEEAEYAVKELGFKVVLINGSVRRPVPASTREDDEERSPYYIDNLALDSEYNYDPLWAKLAELKVAPMTHDVSQGWVDRTSPTNMVFNHIGHFAASGAAFAKALYLGGVTRRFPSLNFAFLEGGSLWARGLCEDLAGHWEKRNETAVLENLRPANLDVDELRSLLERYGNSHYAKHVEDILRNLDVLLPGVDVDELTRREESLGELDDFARVRVCNGDEVKEEFARNFYFGCESDDATTAYAFDERFGPRLKALFSSDISHFDVTDMREVLEEAHELVEGGFLTREQFREFTFSNPVSLHGRANPQFFDGTSVEKAAREELSQLGGAN